MSSESPAAGEPSEILAYLFKHALRRLLALADAALEPHGLDRKEFGVLRMLAAREPLSQQTLAGLLGVDPTTMVAVLDALEDKGIVTRRPDPADRRRNQIALTATGQATSAAAEAAYTAAEEEFLAPLGDVDGEHLRGMLRRLVPGDAA
ncbi:MarR family winged helix-turn-helix transcriptional regulator [Leifsonia sp. EB34]|uniref:MarR family winged helix-turn-helix transcriptional regulator n=1 Tax=Leifsonia sp. EB34 TaxID=3156303 RepID=UPI0035166A42